MPIFVINYSVTEGNCRARECKAFISSQPLYCALGTGLKNRSWNIRLGESRTCKQLQACVNVLWPVILICQRHILKRSIELRHI